MIYGASSREAAFRAADRHWDMIVVGGGITGAGLLREATRAGLDVLLLEQADFASGTSSRSAKLVHGGLRYMNNFQFGMTMQSVAEREQLLREGAGLIEPLPFIIPSYESDKLPGWMLGIGLTMYGWMGGKWWHTHDVYEPEQVEMVSPGIAVGDLNCGFRFFDAQTDDARLVLRVLREGTQGDVPGAGRGLALNYAHVGALLRDEAGQVCGVRVLDRVGGARCEIRATAVVNATGVWADHLRGEIGAEARLRPLRGSHLLFRRDRFPVYQAISFPHPDDGRPVYAVPWEGVTLLGTTDLDHDEALEDPHIHPEETEYLIRAAQLRFPTLELQAPDILSTFAGIRAVISSGHEIDPSKESREHAIWSESGLLTVTGGKLTTFRQIALDALKALKPRFPAMRPLDHNASALDTIDMPAIDLPGLSQAEFQRLLGRYGAAILPLIEAAPMAERGRVASLPSHWIELRHAALSEGVQHLDDLLLRRVRIGLLLPNGGARLMSLIRSIAQPTLNWDDLRWESEEAAYRALWREQYGPPPIQHKKMSTYSIAS